MFFFDVLKINGMLSLLIRICLNKVILITHIIHFRDKIRKFSEIFLNICYYLELLEEFPRDSKTSFK